MSQVVVLTPEQVEDLVNRSFAKAMEAHAQADVALDAEGAAAVLGLDSKRTVQSYVEKKGLPCHVITPTTVRFIRSEILAWLAARPKRGSK